MSASIEVCHIRFEYTREETRGIFNKKEYHYGRYVAEVTRPSGKEIIAQTAEFMTPGSGNSNAKADDPMSWTTLKQIKTDALNQLIQQLLNDGWEVMTTNDKGDVQSLKRQIGATSSGNSSSPADLLKQLASLRDAGILTEEEFHVKKTEILKRM